MTVKKITSSIFPWKLNDKYQVMFPTQSNGDISDEFNRYNCVRLPVDVSERNWERVVAELCLLIIIILTTTQSFWGTYFFWGLISKKFQEPALLNFVFLIAVETATRLSQYLTPLYCNPNENQQNRKLFGIKVHTLTICWTSRMAGIHSDDLIWQCCYQDGTLMV